MRRSVPAAPATASLIPTAKSGSQLSYVGGVLIASSTDLLHCSQSDDLRQHQLQFAQFVPPPQVESECGQVCVGEVPGSRLLCKAPAWILMTRTKFIFFMVSTNIIYRPLSELILIDCCD